VRVQEDLMRLLVETEYKIRLKALKSNRFARRSMDLIDLLTERFKEIQQPLKEESGISSSAK
jgi:hypothetical protein